MFARKYKLTTIPGGDSKCKGVSYDYSKGLGAILVTSPVSSMKTVNSYTKDSDSGAQDTYIWMIRDTGVVTIVKQISFNPSSLSATKNLANVDYGLNSLRTINEYYVFAGQA